MSKRTFVLLLGLNDIAQVAELADAGDLIRRTSPKRGRIDRAPLVKKRLPMLRHIREAHPQMPALIRGARGMLQAASTRMAERLLNEALTADKNTKPRIDAINSALDRAGVPRMKEIAISISADVGAAASAFDNVDSEAIEGEIVEEIDGDASLLPAAPLEIEATDDDGEQAARDAWAAVIPIEELRHVDAAPEPDDYQDAVDARNNDDQS